MGNQSVPAATTLVAKLALSDAPAFLGYYQGCVYATLDNGTVALVDHKYSLKESYITCPDLVQWATMYNDKIYMLIWKSIHLGYEVRVYDVINRNEIHRFFHRFHQRGNSVLTAVSDQIVIVDPPSQLTVYSLSGQPLSQVTCLKVPVHPRRISICPCYDDSVIITERDSPYISRINIRTGETVWRCRYWCIYVQATCFARRYVILASYYGNTFLILDTQTGEEISRIAVEGASAQSGADSILCARNILIIGRSQQSAASILIYKISIEQ